MSIGDSVTVSLWISQHPYSATVCLCNVHREFQVFLNQQFLCAYWVLSISEHRELLCTRYTSLIYDRLQLPRISMRLFQLYMEFQTLALRLSTCKRRCLTNELQPFLMTANELIETYKVPDYFHSYLAIGFWNWFRNWVLLLLKRRLFSSMYKSCKMLFGCECSSVAAYCAGLENKTKHFLWCLLSLTIIYLKWRIQGSLFLHAILV